MGARPFRARVLRDWGRALALELAVEGGARKLSEALALFESSASTREAQRSCARSWPAGLVAAHLGSSTPRTDPIGAVGERPTRRAGHALGAIHGRGRATNDVLGRLDGRAQ